jgi:hypothetical protein
MTNGFLICFYEQKSSLVKPGLGFHKQTWQSKQHEESYNIIQPTHARTSDIFSPNSRWVAMFGVGDTPATF